MARRSGLGQRGLDILIPDHSSDSGSEKNSRKKESKAKTGKAEKTRKTVDSAERFPMKEHKKADKPESADLSEPGKGYGQSGQTEVDINKVEPNRSQPRKQFDEDTLQELADSIRLHGIIQPLIVQKREDYYEIVAGERRWRAAKIAGLKTVPVLIRDYSDKDAMELSLIENIQREDLNPIEEAQAFRRLIEEYSLTQDEAAERVGKSRTAVTNSLRLLNLDERVQKMLIDEMLSSGHVRALLSIDDRDVQYQTAQKAFDEKMSVREVEAYVRKLQKKPEKKKEVLPGQLQAVYSDMEERMKRSLGTKVRIQSKTPEKGKIEIEYYTGSELERICHILLAGESE